jgi:RNA ligase
MTHLNDVVDCAELGDMIDEDYVQVRFHPDYPYAIYCYTKKAMFDRKWNHTTMTCRGLIVNEDTGEVLARPFKKFFNLGEPDAPIWNHTDWVSVYDKADGSLGIAYDTPDGPAIATKGSFTSEQALKATELLRTLYPRYMHDDVNTDLFEIIYPENRIVLDYGDEESLRYLGSVNIADGDGYWNGLLMSYWGIPRNKVLQSAPFSQLKLDMNRPNAEGYVLFNEGTGERLKVKQEDYLELHKVMTGLNERQIWEWMREGKYSKDILPDLPEEMHAWASRIINDLSGKFLHYKGLIFQAFKESSHMSRKEFAIFHSQKPAWMRCALFARLDKNYDQEDEILWKLVRP